MSVHLSKEVAKLKKKILQLCAEVEENVRRAVLSVVSMDAAAAEDVRRKDMEIDRMEIEIEEECLKILALHQPVANDLRYVIACLKLSNDLERVGDQADNIARRTLSIIKHNGQAVPVDFTPMMDKTRAMLKKALDCLIDMDSRLAAEVIESDAEINRYHKKMYDEIRTFIKKDPENFDYYINLSNVSRHLERIGDYATNIAEDVIYMVDGEIVRHKVTR
jgi:phosphate transport system protein